MQVNSQSLHIHDSWKAVLADEFTQPYFSHIQETLLQEQQEGYIVYPK
jgi:uracil DNA glycosylase